MHKDVSLDLIIQRIELRCGEDSPIILDLMSLFMI